MEKLPYSHIHFIGIGGIGMSALARHFLSEDKKVSGSDREDSEILQALKTEGVETYSSQAAENIKPSVDCFVYTLAIPEENPELQVARASGLPIFTYAEMLGEVSKNIFTLAIAGTHGKTTTTGMTSEIFIDLGLKPTVIVGSLLAGGRTNFIKGKDLFIVEACEYGRSFLNLHPDILVITNIEADHLDCYKNLEDVQQAFYDLALKVPQNGKIVCDKKDKNLKKIVKDFSDKIIDYPSFVSDVPEMNVFGDYNVLNAAAAIGAARAYEIISKNKFTVDEIQNGLKKFKGTWRRLEHKRQLQGGAELFDDYGHHPTAVLAVTKAFKEKFPDKKLAVIFQPHLYSRTKDFLEDFVDSLAAYADLSILIPIYAAREKSDGTISSEILANQIIAKKKRAVFCDDAEEVAEVVMGCGDDWIILTLGAGDVYKVGDIL